MTSSTLPSAQAQVQAPEYANGKSAEKSYLPIMKMESVAAEYEIVARHYKLEKARVDALKGKLIDSVYAALAADNTEEISSFRYSFPKDDGSINVTLTIPDPSTLSNRTSLSDASLKSIAKVLGESFDASCTEMAKTITLTGSWVDWFETAVASLKSAGADVPDTPDGGVSRRQLCRLTQSGLKKLLRASWEGTRKTLELVKTSIKSPTVHIK